MLLKHSVEFRGGAYNGINFTFEYEGEEKKLYIPVIQVRKQILYKFSGEVREDGTEIFDLFDSISLC